jgi:hypothetical protein
MSLWPKLERDWLNEMNANNFKTNKGELLKILKEWDKRYEKHRRGPHLELSAVQKESM